ncbi:MAG: hypothetical protein HYY96_07985 [Candidatus Tectomicrobia bacterium]|nr:hypothetical protein [Candidatus Tectomicrobia bacterium]
MKLTLHNRLLADVPIAKVWTFFNDVSTLASCVPTCEGHQQIDEDNVELLMRLKIGLIPVENRAHMTVTERRPPARLRAHGVSYSGEAFAQRVRDVDKGATAQVEIQLDLSPQGEEQTCIVYTIDVEAVGRLRRIFEAVLKSKRNQLEGQFISNVARILNSNIKVLDET